MNDEQVPFIVRTETGVIDRGIYTIWTLDGGAATGAQWSGEGWNGRLVYRFGGGCGTGYSQGAGAAVGIDVDLLGRGYAVATNTLDVLATACNDVLSAEAMMMTREHFIEQYGVPDYTIGDGGSGGAIQQLSIAQNYPGLLDAVSAQLPVPDVLPLFAELTDCGLLLNYEQSAAGAALTAEQQLAISGHASALTCVAWRNAFLPIIDPTVGCDNALVDQIYDPATRAKGVRCTFQDINVAWLGRDPKTGFANRPLDNVGVQYGLQAVNDRVISVDQFLDLNEHIGGYDIDGKIVAERETATRKTLDNVYRSGRMLDGGSLEIPIILRTFSSDEQGDLHTRVWPFAIRERLQDRDTDDPSLVLWTDPPSLNLELTTAVATASGNEAILVLDEWLTDHDKPPRAQNACKLPDGRTLQGGWELYDDPGPCRAAYRQHSNPRIVAGESVAGDILKCALTPVDASTYRVPITDAQVTRLKSIFSTGVCDWTKPGIGQQPPTGTWQTFGL